MAALSGIDGRSRAVLFVSAPKQGPPVAKVESRIFAGGGRAAIQVQIWAHNRKLAGVASADYRTLLGLSNTVDWVLRRLVV